MIGLLQILTLFAISMNGIQIGSDALHLNSERILVALVAPAVLIVMVFGRRTRFTPSAWLYLGWVFAVFLSALTSSDFLAHLNGLLISVAPFFYFLLFMQPGLKSETMGRAIEITLWWLSLGSIAVFALWLKYEIFPDAIDRGRIAFTMTEPNILGSALASLAVVHFGFFQRRIRHVALHVCALAALLLTASKLPYFAYVVGVFFFLFRSGKLRGVTAAVLGGFSLSIITAMGILFSGSVYDFYRSVLDRPDAVNNRMFALQIGWQRFLEHPILGNGPLDFALFNQTMLTWMGSTNARDMWIWQIWLAVLHDEGLFGFAFFAAFLVTSWVSASRLIRSGDVKFVGYSAAVLANIVASQGTTTHLMAIFGMLMGLLNSAPTLRKARTLKAREIAARRPLAMRPT